MLHPDHPSSTGYSLVHLPERFRRAGFATHAVGKVYHQSRTHRFQDAFDTNTPMPKTEAYYRYQWDKFDGYLRPDHHCPGNFSRKGADGVLGPAKVISGTGGIWACSWASVTDDFQERYPLPDTQSTDKALQILASHGAGAGGAPAPAPPPLLLVVGYMKPHLPFVAPRRFFRLYPDERIRLPGTADRVPSASMPFVAFAQSAELFRYVDILAYTDEDVRLPFARAATAGTSREALPSLPTAVYRDLLRAYYACVSYVDHEAGRVLDALDTPAFKHSTVTLLLSDHGFHLGHQGQWAKHTVYQEATSIPFVLRLPGVGASVRDEYAELVDVYATLVHAGTGEAVPRCASGASALDGDTLCTQGESLVPLLAQQGDGLLAPQRRAAAFSQYYRRVNVRPEALFSPHEAGIANPTAPPLRQPLGTAVRVFSFHAPMCPSTEPAPTPLAALKTEPTRPSDCWGVFSVDRSTPEKARPEPWQQDMQKSSVRLSIIQKSPSTHSPPPRCARVRSCVHVHGLGGWRGRAPRLWRSVWTAAGVRGRGYGRGYGRARRSGPWRRGRAPQL